MDAEGVVDCLSSREFGCNVRVEHDDIGPLRESLRVLSSDGIGEVVLVSHIVVTLRRHVVLPSLQV